MSNYAHTRPPQLDQNILYVFFHFVRRAKEVLELEDAYFRPFSDLTIHVHSK